MITEANMTSDAQSFDDYAKALWRRKHYVVLLTIVGLVLSSVYAKSLSRHYVARAQVVVGLLPTESQFSGPNLDKEKAVIASDDTTRAVLDAVGSKMAVTEAQQHLSVTFVPNSDVLRVAYSDKDAAFATKMATQYAITYVSARENTKTAYYQTRITQLDETINGLTAQITPLSQNIADLDSTLLKYQRDPNYSKDPGLQDQADKIRADITAKTTQVATLTAQRQAAQDQQRQEKAAQASAPPSATVTRPATTPSAPEGLSNKMLYAIGLIGGLAAGIAVALFLDRFDRTARSERDVERMLGTPVLASVPSFPRNAAANGLIMLRNVTGRRAAAARDSYRRLRSTIDFLCKRSDMKTFLVTSPRPGDGKSTTAINLAIASAQTGRKVAIVSADMHRPTLERLLSLPDSHGLSDYLLEESEAILTEIPTIPNLTAVTSGKLVDNPAELLASSRVAELVKLLEENHDLVIFDTPPVLNASDALALASRVDGVIVVTDSRGTNSADLEQLRDEMELVGARIIGSVLNHHKLGGKRNTYAYASNRRPAEA